MGKRVKKLFRFSTCWLLVAAFVLSGFFMPVSAQAAKPEDADTVVNWDIRPAESNFIPRWEAVQAAVKLLGAVETGGTDNPAADLKKDAPYYSDMRAAFHAGLITLGRNGKLRPEAEATNQYMASLFAKVTGNTAKELLGDKSSKKAVTRDEFNEFVEKTVADVIAKSTNKVKNGNVIINKPDVTLENVTVNGNLIIGDGVGNKEAVLHNVTVTGLLLVRGGGENSILVTGNSNIKSVDIRQVNDKVSLKIRDGAKVDNVTILEGSRDVKLEGKVDKLTVEGSGLAATAQNAVIGQVTVKGQNVSLKTDGSTVISTVTLEESSLGSSLDVSSGSTVKKANIKIDGAKLNAKGTVEAVEVMADNVSMTGNFNSIIVEDGVSGTKMPNPENNNSGSGGGESGGSSGNNSGNGGTQENITIQGIYPKAGSVRVVLSRAAELDSSAFYISCPAGKDMTILSAETEQGAGKNRIYNLKTAFYADNTYILTIKLPNGKVIDKKFTTNSSAPELNSISAERKDDRSAVLYVSALSPGVLYYMAVPGTAAAGYGVKALALTGSSAPDTPEELKKNGESVPVSTGLNTIAIHDIKAQTPYTIYLASSGSSNDTPVMQGTAEISKTPEQGDTASVSIIECEGVSSNEIVIKFSEPVKESLALSAISAVCPAQSNITLGRVETQDSQTFHIYLKDYSHMKSYNHYTVTVTFKDGTQASSKFYGDFQWPIVTEMKVKRVEDGKIKVIFSVDEPGTTYYLINNDENKSDSIKPENVLSAGNQVPLYAGVNELYLDNISFEQKSFYMVCVDKKGNTPRYVEHESIPATVTPEDSTPAGNEIIEVTAGNNTMGTILNFTLKETADLSDVEQENIVIRTISGDGTGTTPKPVGFGGAGGSFRDRRFYITLGVFLPSGTYSLEINSKKLGLMKAEFTID